MFTKTLSKDFTQDIRRRTVEMVGHDHPLARFSSRHGPDVDVLIRSCLSACAVPCHRQTSGARTVVYASHLDRWFRSFFHCTHSTSRTADRDSRRCDCHRRSTGSERAWIWTPCLDACCSGPRRISSGSSSNSSGTTTSISSLRGGQGTRRRRARTRPALGRVSGRIGGSPHCRGLYHTPRAARRHRSAERSLQRFTNSPLTGSPRNRTRILLSERLRKLSQEERRVCLRKSAGLSGGDRKVSPSQQAPVDPAVLGCAKSCGMRVFACAATALPLLCSL